MPEPTHYELLEISQNASTEVIDAAWRALQKRYHPDNRQTGNAALSSKINDAHDILMDPLSRRKYDAGLSATGSGSGTRSMGIDWDSIFNPQAYPSPYSANLEATMIQLAEQAAGVAMNQALSSMPPELREALAKLARTATANKR